MLGSQTDKTTIQSFQAISVDITDQSYVGFARRQAMGLAELYHFSQNAIDRIAIIINELGTNLIKYASTNKARQILFQIYQHKKQKIFELLVMDKGPGIQNLAECMQDGYSSKNTAGNGLGAVSRLADHFKVYTQPEQGTIVLAQVQEDGSLQLQKNLLAHQIAGICLPISTEEISGDSWTFYQTPSKTRVLVADGLGHGVDAAHASQLACEVFHKYIHLPISEIIMMINSALRKTRGAAIAIANIDNVEQQVKFAGLGNIAGYVSTEQKYHHMVSHDGTAGIGSHKVQEYTYPWDSKAVLIMHSDGLNSRWSLKDYSGIATNPPAILASALYRDFQRGNDDVTVVVAKNNLALDVTE